MPALADRGPRLDELEHQAALTVSEENKTPVQRWREAAPWLPAVTGPQATAEGLLLILHYSIDYSGWVGKHLATYWDHTLPSRVHKATYRVDTLDWWWAEISRELNATPSAAGVRRELAALLREDPLPVLDVLRREAVALVLRVRLISEAVRGQKEIGGKTL
nr:hypothetical protein [Dietzia sp. CQ4]